MSNIIAHYPLSAVSNRDLQLLYHYRMLRQPSGSLMAVYTGTEGLELTLDQFNVSGEYSVCTLALDVPPGKVPLIEFIEEGSTDWKCLPDLVALSLTDSGIQILASKDAVIPTPIKIRLFWCSTLADVDRILSGYASALKELAVDLKKLQEEVASLNFDNVYMKAPSGINNNLVKFKVDSVDGVTTISLTDSEHQITEATASQTFFNPSQADLATMVKSLQGDIAISVTDNQKRYLDGFSGHTITISGSGDWYINNTSSAVRFSKFTGKVQAVNCPYLLTSDRLSLSEFRELLLYNSYFQAYGGVFKMVRLCRRSVLDYEAGYLEFIDTIGPGSECYIGPAVQYWTRWDYSKNEFYPDRQEPVPDPRVAYCDILGTLCTGDGVIIKNGVDISFQGGQHDCQLPPTELDLEATFELHVDTLVPPPLPTTGTAIEDAVASGIEFVDATVSWLSGSVPANMRTIEFAAGLIANSKWETGGTVDNIPAGVDTTTSWGNIYHMATNAYGTFYGAWCMMFSAVANAWSSNVSESRTIAEAVPVILNAAQGTSGTSWETMVTFLSSWSGEFTAAGMAEVVAVMERYTNAFNLVTPIGQAAAVAAGCTYNSTETETVKRRNSAEDAFNLLTGQ